ncbi:MAG: phage tail tape measure protein, partial [Candidatus Thermoplasmatota archaeon]
RNEMVEERLDVIVSATDKASGVIKNITSSFLNLKTLLAGAVVGGVIYFAKESFEAFAKVDHELRKALIYFDEFSDEIYSRAFKTLKQITRTTPFISMEESAKGLQQLANAGMKVEDALKLLPEIAKFSEVTMLDMGKSADLAMVAMKTYGFSIEQISNLMDKFFIAQKKGLMNAEEMYEAFMAVGQIASEMHVSFDDLLTTLAIFSDAGIRGAQAGNTLRRILTNISAQDEKTMKILKEMNVQIYDQHGNMRALSDITFDLMKALKDTTDEQRIFYLLGLADARALSGLSALLKDGKMKFEEYKNAIQNSTGAVNEHAKIIETGAAASYREFVNWIEQTKTSIGAAIYDYMIKPAIDLRDTWATIFGGEGNLATYIKGFVGAGLVSFNTFAIALYPLFSGIYDIIMNYLGYVWEEVKVCWAGAGEWFSENVITPITNFFSNLGTAILNMFYNAYTGIQNIWQGISSWFNTNVITPITNFFSGIYTSITNIFGGIYNWFVENVINPIVNAWNATIGKLPLVPNLPTLPTIGGKGVTTTTQTTNIILYQPTIETDPREFINVVRSITGT